jgi:RHS repeat-associated protein
MKENRLFSISLFIICIVMALFIAPTVMAAETESVSAPEGVREYVIAPQGDPDPAAEENAPPQANDVPQQAIQGSETPSGNTGSFTPAAATNDNKVIPYIATDIPTPESQQLTGAATMRIPIEVPPGRNNVAPRLELTYNSQQKNGWIGVGWTIDIGYIQRSTKWGLDYNKNAFVASINGTTSELVPRADWGSNCYGSSVEGAFSKLCYSADNWTATAKDGTRYYFGSTVASRQDPAQSGKTFKWCLDTIVDTNGNFVTFTYVKSQGEIYPNRIEYTGNSAGGLSPSNAIQFVRESIREDKIKSYETGGMVRTDERLKEIQVYANSSPVRKYELTYTTSNSTRRSVLTKIVRRGSDNAGALPAITFTPYNTYDPFTQGIQTGTRYLSTEMSGIGDFNGDGSMDFIAKSSTSSKSYVHISGSNNQFAVYEENLAILSEGFHWITDFNGDGCTDYGNWAINTGITINFSRCNANRTYGGFTQQKYSVNVPVPWFGASFLWSDDFNGDGKTDVMNLLTETSANVHLAKVDANGTFSFNTVSNVKVDAKWLYPGIQLIFGDFNGDGRTDFATWVTDLGSLRVHLATVDANGNFTGFTIQYWNASITRMNKNSAYAPVIWVGDFNGDGKTDIASYKDNTSIYMNLSTGSAFVTETWYNSLTTVLDITRVMDVVKAGDFNSDGLTDLIGYDDGYRAYVNLSTGSGFNRQEWPATLDFNGRFHVGDFNGDNKADVISWRDNDSINTHYSAYPPADLIKTINNGIGGVSTITYTPSSDWINGVLPFLIHTVSKIDVSDGNGVITTNKYTYTGGLYNFPDREFYGFRYVKKTDPVSTVTETWFRQNESSGVMNRYKGLIETQSVTDAYNSKYTSINNTYNYTTPATGVAFPYLVTRVEKLWLGSLAMKQLQTNYTYDNYGNVTAKRYEGDTTATGDEQYEITTYGYNTASWILDRPASLTITDRAGNVEAKTFFTYDARGNLTQRKDWLDGVADPVTSYTYTACGNQETITDPKQNVTRIGYDPTWTYVTKTTNPLNHITTATYDYRFGKPLARTDAHLEGDPSPSTTTYTYDVFGRLRTETAPDASVITYTYNNFGSVGSQNVKILFPDTSWKEVYFDGLTRDTTIKRSAPEATKNILTKTTYNTRGLVSGKSLPCFTAAGSMSCSETQRWTTSDYDTFGRLTKITYPDASTMTKSYTPLRTTTVDQMGFRKIHEKDAHDRLIRVEEYAAAGALYATTLYGYDTLGNLVTITDAAGNQTTMTYDPLSRKVAINDPDMGQWLYGYDLMGNLTSQTDAKGITITFTYDPLSRVTQKNYPTGKKITYAYDEALSTNSIGRLTTISDPSGTEKYNYDTMGRVTELTKTIDSASYTTKTSYDAMGRIATFTYPDEETITYAYDTGGNATGITGYVTYSSFNAVGQPGTAAYNNGVTTRYQYYPLNNRLYSITTNSISAGALQNLSHTYDKAGNITGIVDLIDEGRSQTFTYDHLNRLTQAQSDAYGIFSGTPTGTFSWQYDEIGNITYNSHFGSYTYGTKPHAVLQAGTNAYIYDANGNMINRAGVAITYDDDNRPIALGGMSDIFDTQDLSFAYDAKGQRVKKTVNTVTCLTILFGYEMCYTINTTTLSTKHYECTNGTCKKYLFSGNTRVVVKTDTETWYYHPDHLGSSNIVTDASGNKAETTYYYPYGWVREDYGAVNVKHKFTGQELDYETGLCYYGARYYDSKLGRFITADPVDPKHEDPQSLNRYAYCLNNPLKYVDPTGNTPDMLGNDTDPPAAPNWLTNTVEIAIKKYRENRAWVNQQETKKWNDRRNELEKAGLPEKEIDRHIEILKIAEDSIMGSALGMAAKGFTSVKNIGKLGEAAEEIGITSKDILGNLGRAGKGQGIREVVGDVSDARALFDKLRGNNVVKEVKPGVFVAEGKSGGHVTLRKASRSGPPTIDVHGIEQGIRKIKFVSE